MKRWLLPLYRAALFGLILALIHDQHRAYSIRTSHAQPPLQPDQVQPWFAGVDRLRPDPALPGALVAENAEGARLGFVVQTSPASDSIIGFSGPNNILIVFGADDRIKGLRILSSGDTREHLDKVRQDERFLGSFTGLTWEEARARRDVDAVSGATLTSLAMVEGILRRFAGQAPSLRFPDPISIEEVAPWFADARELAPDPARPGLWHVLDAQTNTLGMVARTSPAADSEIGYQGPTELLIVLDRSGRAIDGLAIRSSYDNQPYVRYVGEDGYFFGLFNGLALEAVAELDLAEAEIEGVSGATMTSMAAARGLVKAARALRPGQAPGRGGVSLRARDAGTLTMILLGLVLAFSRLRGRPGVRLGFQLGLIGYLGFLNGDMVSQALLAGWAKHGLPWRFAPGLVCLTAAALVVPLVTRRQVYCHHLCPHGAAQQLLKRLVRWRPHFWPWIPAAATFLPVLLLVWVLLVAMLHLPVSLVAIEPFDAYMVRVAGWATLAVAIVGLVAALFVPMAYCRYGCPTGAVLNFLWGRGQSARWTRRDHAALGFVVLALVLRLVG